ncbi:TNFAIP3-interacting protein 1-like isoform X1 [Corvus kubaryi]|uniref:TNFAIP3-interacting protein 1-like isoform X1 n=1 Tax=Corvus kubaryi TaxID=68294 RepID=UPI001C0569FC|nr:TNFAIP3-interacting protein 1-like isoform X1 [Corvus kubaryi]XP_041869815.1 TNFAIP3-interacting protein 1-like isoform X1 [Corvus kubaryi]XP_041870446.1 TNFAIP3-interacting protein 1-like isoform X1 [Corvus kubaryi]XP_041870447.1 TNFAIP3-interacting protein 1-like isoform X1 [Corvus kubaryi]
MEGRGPYHIYDPGGGSKENGSTALERLVEENTRLKEKMQGIKSIGELLEESQVEASKLRQKAEDLVKDNKMLIGSPSLEDLVETGAVGPDPSFTRAVPGSAQPDTEARKSPPSGSSSEFEIVAIETQGFPQESRRADLEQPPNEDANLLPQLQQLENTLSGCAKEASKDQVFVRMGYMASELKRLASKVHKNEQRTSFLQTLCETLHSENKELRTKLEHDLEQRNQALEKLRCENQELRRMVTLSSQDSGKREAAEQQQQSGAMVEKAPGREELEAKEKKVKILEHQRRELLEVNKQWDQHFRSMKQKYEQKVTDLHQELAEARRAVTELESEREQKQRDFDRKLLLAKSRIETEEAEKERLAMEVRDLQQRMRFLQEQLAPVTRQREYQEKEIQRLNKALEEALNVQASPPPIFAMEPAGKLPQQELLTQNELLKQQVKIFEEDFQRERSDRERMNEEKEELKQQLEKLQKQLVLSNNQLRASKDDCQREKEEKEKLKKLLKQHKQASGERLHPEPGPGPLGPACPMYQYQYSPPMAHPMYHGYDEWQQIRYPPATPGEHTQGQNFHHFPPPEYPWRPPCAMAHSQNAQPVAGVKPVPKDLEQAGPGLP